MTFLSRRKLPTTAACATAARRPTAISRLTRLAAIVVGSCLVNSAAHAQDFSPAQLQFRPVAYGQEGTDSSVGPDNKGVILRTAAQIQAGKRAAEDDAEIVIRTDLPGPERLFDTRKSETMMREAIRRDSTIRSGPDR